MSSGFNTDGLFTFPQSESPINNCLDSIKCAIAFDVRDWSEDRRSAWIYGIVFGWGSAIDEIKQKFNWDANDIERLRIFHEEWNKLELHISGKER